MKLYEWLVVLVDVPHQVSQRKTVYVVFIWHFVNLHILNEMETGPEPETERGVFVVFSLSSPYQQ